MKNKKQFTWHLHYTEQIDRRCDYPLKIVYKMLQSIPFRVHCIANRLDQEVSSRIWSDLLRPLSIRMSIRVVRMRVWTQCDQDMVDSKTNSIARLSLSRSLLCVLLHFLLLWEQFWLDFFLIYAEHTQTHAYNHKRVQYRTIQILIGR